MMDVDRRRYLSLLGGALAGTAGCLEAESEGPGAAESTDTPPDPHRTNQTETPTARTADRVTGTTDPTDTHTPTTTPAPSLVLERVEPSETPLTVFPKALASLLRSAATSETPVRTHAETFVYSPEPILPTVDTVELVDPSGDASGVYEVSGEAGIRYELLLTAEPSDPPENASVTPVSSIPEQHRDLVVSAITGEGRPSVYPESEAGEWVRNHFFGEYVSYEGTTYQGAELEQTDAAFFSTTAWYILSLTPVEDEAGAVTLRLGGIDPSVRAGLDPVLDDWAKHQDAPVLGPERVDESIASFAEQTDGLLIHTHAFDVRTDQRS